MPRTNRYLLPDHVCHVTSLTVVLIFAAAGICDAGLSYTQLVDRAAGVSATIITIPAAQNRGFAVLDVPVRMPRDTVRNHWTNTYELMINGGFFMPDNTPAGYCRINERVLVSNVVKRWSGMVAIDAAGTLSLLHRTNDFSSYPTVLQIGPYVIDPGGTIGIRSDDRLRAERTLIGVTTSGTLLIMTTKPVTLFDLAVAVKMQMPDVERLLNLDGGPSTALKTADLEVVNRSPVRNYIVKQRAKP